MRIFRFLFVLPAMLVLLAACKGKQEEKSSQEAVQLTPLNMPEPEKSSLTPMVATGRYAIVLFDDTKAYSQSAETNSPVLRNYQTGDILLVISRKESPADSVWYQVENPSSAAWLAASQIFVFEEERIFYDFLHGTMPLNQLGDESEEKIKILNSKKFYERALKNPDPRVKQFAQNHIDWL